MIIVENKEFTLNDYLCRLYGKSTDELEELLCAKLDRESIGKGLSFDEWAWKEKFNEYCANEAFDLIPQQYIALLSSKNIFDDAYKCFLANPYGDYEDDYYEMNRVLQDTADTLLLSVKDAYRPIDVWKDVDTYYLVGRSVDSPEFYNALVIKDNCLWGFEYDCKPSREKVFSDYTDKLAAEDIDRGEAGWGEHADSVIERFSDNIVADCKQTNDKSKSDHDDR